MTDLEKRIQQVIDGLRAKNINLSVNRVITASLFSTGGTLGGCYEAKIKEMIHNQPANKSGLKFKK